MTNSSDMPWSRLMDLVENMLDAAKTADWQELNDLNHQYQPMLENYFSEFAPRLDTALIKDRIYVLQSIEQQLLGLCETAHTETGENLQGLRRGKIAEQAYSSHATAF